MNTQEAFRRFREDPCLPGWDDPYKVYDQLRLEAPIHWCEGPQMWMIVSYHEAYEQLKDHRFSRQQHLDKLISRFGTGHIFERQKHDLPFMDGQDHAKMRHHVINAYRRIDFPSLKEFTASFLDSRLESLSHQKQFDVVHEVADLLPVMVVSELLGVPADKQEEVGRKVGSFVRARGLTQTESTMERGDDSIAFYEEYFLPLIHEKRKNPSSDLLSRLIADPEEGVHLSDEQLLLIISSNFYSASIATLRLLVGTLVWAMALNPDAYARIQDNRELVVPALEELLRWDPPAQATNASVALEDIEIGGKLVKKGDSLSVLVGAANRDPKTFPDPDQFLLDRHPNPHVSFAPGLHQCLGLQIARMEGQAALNAFCDHFSSLSVIQSESQRFVGDRFRGFDRLMLEVSRR
ncbi:MAG: cytochrome P450 [Synechococcus sp. s2_metabat2_7]|nr:cytochrome P450 [Synechococcus sp. s2_metabat2_7]